MNPTAIDLQISIPAHTRYLAFLGNLTELLVREIEEYKGDRDLLGYHLNIVITEAVANAIQHVNKNEKEQAVTIHIHVNGDNLSIKVYDQGEGFDLAAIQAPNFDALVDVINESGRGLFMIKELMDTVDCYRCPSGNVLEMSRKLTMPGKPSDT